jgi:uncharacterized Zn finger protein
MRCMMCGTDMVLLRTVADHSNDVQGFERQTLHCPSCGDVERRRIFRRDTVSYGVKQVNKKTWARVLARLDKYFGQY